MGCKVDTLVERHGLTVPDPGYESVDEYLVARWTGADGRSADGYKTLTEWFNKRLLERLYEQGGRDVVPIHLDREYDLLTDGDEDLSRDELAADLAADGLDADEITGEMISWSTMRHHLKGCLDAEKNVEPAETDWESNTVRVATETATEKAESVLTSLAGKGRLPGADRAAVEVQVKLSCPECSVRVPFQDAVERGYVCETHFDRRTDREGEEGEGSEDAGPTGYGDESVRERVRNQLSGLTLPYAAVETVGNAILGESLLLEAAAFSGL